MTARPRVGLATAGVLFIVLSSLADGACGDGSDAPSDPARPSPTPLSGAASSDDRSSETARARMAWTLERLFRRIDGRRIRIGRRTMRVDTATLACGGMLRHERRGPPTFARFRCVQPTFASDGSPGPDLIFRVMPTGRRTLVIVRPRLTSY